MPVAEVCSQVCLVAERSITELAEIVPFLMSLHMTPQAERFHDLVALVTLCSPLHSHSVLNLLVVDNAVLGEELQAADATVGGKVLQGELGHVRIQGILVFFGTMHL